MNEQQEIIAPLDMTVGEILKNARTMGRRKREISTIAKLLCIKEEFLTALEEGNYRFIPEDVYILGFARSYAAELGLDTEEILLKLKKELKLIEEEEKEEEEEDSEPDSQKKSLKINKEIMTAWVKQALQYVKKHWVWFVSALSVILVVVIAFVIVFSEGTPTESLQQQDEIIVSEEPAVVQEETKEPEFRYPVHEIFEVKNRQESRVVLQAEKESWVKIEDARGNSVFSRVLIPGDVYYMPASDKLKATFGNAGAIDVWLDGQLLEKLGPANTKKTGISMAPDALKSVGFVE